DLGPGRHLLYLGDNSGEIVFDTLLVEQILKTGTTVTYTVKSGPIINDATMDDAVVSGMTKLTKVIETGSDDIGVNWRRSSKQFKKAFSSSDVIIAKGHGNFETCDELPGNIYSLLKAKCNVVAAVLGVKLGDMVFHHTCRRK
ncbi:MAG: ARMT1-like domain-containing protein, partial [bacterium]